MSNGKQELLRRVAAEVRAAQRAAEAVDEAISERLGLSRSELAAVDELYPDRRVTSGDLARATLLTAGAMTVLLDRLEAAGYVRRERDPHDRRRVYITLTEDGRAIVGHLYEGLAGIARPTADRYTVEQLVTILDFLARERAVREAYARSLRAIGEVRQGERGSGIAAVSRLIGDVAGWASRAVGEVAGELSRTVSEEASRRQRRLNDVAEEAADRVRGPAERAARRINAALDPGHPDRRRPRDRRD